MISALEAKHYNDEQKTQVSPFVPEFRGLHPEHYHHCNLPDIKVLISTEELFILCL